MKKKIKIGTKAKCCGNPCIWTGKYWSWDGKVFRHIPQVEK